MIAVQWGSNAMIALYIAVGVVVAAVVTYLVMRKTVRTRVRTEREIRDDTDINDWLVIFNWSRKALYMPTLLVSLAAGVIMFLHEGGVLPGDLVPRVVGAVWFGVFFLNFLVEEFEVSVKIVLILALCLLAMFLWLHLLGWVGSFLRVFGRISVVMGPVAYLLVTLLGLLAIGVSWIRGLFYYAVFTPNFMNLQWGPTESGDHISREDYNTHVNTEDVLERLMGFGRIIIIFKDQKRPPLTFLVWRIGRKAQMLEKVRGKFAIDMQHAGLAPGGDPRPAPPPSAPADSGPVAQSEPE